MRALKVFLGDSEMDKAERVFINFGASTATRNV
jgi:hypothetical protein